MESVSYQTFITTISSVIGFFSIIGAYLFMKIASQNEKISSITTAQTTGSRDEERLFERLNGMEDSIKKVDDKATRDSRAFTEILGEFNVTLTRMDTTLRHIDETMKEHKIKLTEHDQKLNK